MKNCSRCKEDKPLSEFHNQKSSKDGKRPYCKSCNVKRVRKHRKENAHDRKRYAKNRALKKKYGITLDEYNKMLASQGGGCKICGAGANNKPLAVDHDHITGKIRGLLCSTCNTGLGMFNDSPGLLEEAANYLRPLK